MQGAEERIVQILLNEIEEIYHIEGLDPDVNLLSAKVGIPIEDFIFLFSNLEKKYNIDMYSIVEQNDFKVFTVNNLARQIAGE